VWQDHSTAAVDLCFRVRFHPRRLPVISSGRSRSDGRAKQPQRRRAGGRQVDYMNRSSGLPLVQRRQRA
jgi:hypothetical protein